MGATPEDTQREIVRLRGDMSAALEEFERRFRGGLRGAATTEARISGVRAGEDALTRARENPTLLGVAGVVVAGAVAYGAYALVSGGRKQQKPLPASKVEVESRSEIKKKRGQSTVIKKFVWAAFLSVFLAVASVIARRLADSAWRAMIHEEPPTEKSRAAST